MTREHAIKLRKMIVKASASLSDTDALQSIELFDNWKADTAYTTDTRLRYGGKLPNHRFCCPDVDTINVFQIEKVEECS